MENEENNIHGFEGELLSKENEVYKILLRTFNKILFNFLQKNVDGYIQDIVDEYHELKNTDKHTAKKIIRKLTGMYGVMKLKNRVKILKRYMVGCGKKNCSFIESVLNSLVMLDMFFSIIQNYAIDSPWFF